MPDVLRFIIECGDARWPLVPPVMRTAVRAATADLSDSRDLLREGVERSVSIRRAGTVIYLCGAAEAIDDIFFCITRMPEIMTLIKDRAVSQDEFDHGCLACGVSWEAHNAAWGALDSADDGDFSIPKSPFDQCP
jgi:hypothetical protein